MINQINCNGALIKLEIPKVMGILNITPDSFYDGASFLKETDIERKITEFISEGASFIDIGAVSTRPGADFVSEKEEWSRLQKALQISLKYNNSVIFTLDTFRANIAKKAISEFGISIINDISAGESDPEMFAVIAESKVPYCIMHMKGTPQTMQENPMYNNIIEEICIYFSEKIKILHNSGIHDIIIDPGFGFGKTLEHNYTLLHHLVAFKIFTQPLLIGISRKSMIYKLLNVSPKEALYGSIAANTAAILKGVNILRVHDVKETMEAIRICCETQNNSKVKE